jgi:hypothetical protein
MNDNGLHDPNYQKQLAAFRRRVNVLAIDAHKLFTPIDVAGTFIGAGYGVLEDAFGPELCDEYFTQMVEEMKAGDDEAGPFRMPTVLS